MRRIITAGLLGASLTVVPALVACDNGDETVEVAEYEDCDVEDQRKKEDDCGYWQKGSEVRSGAQPDMTWFWVWFTWVHLGQTSRAPAGWVPPKGVTPPTKIVTRPKSKVCAMSITAIDALMAPAPPRPPAPAPRVNNPAPRPPANAPKNNPPKQYTPPKPGQRPAGC